MLVGFEEIQKTLQESKKLPNRQRLDGYDVKWYNLSDDHKKFEIFPKKLKPENFNQGDTGLCFLFSSLSSISTIPGLINQLFGKNEKWWINKSFIVYMFYDNEKCEIIVNDSFPFYDGRKGPEWIWSKPAGNELFAKIIEKAYLIYKLISHCNREVTSVNINKIIYKGGKERNAMKILINAKTENIFKKKYSDFNYEEMFKKIKDYKENKKALITLARIFNDKAQTGHSYSVLAAWELKRGTIKKQILCIKNPWEHGYNKQENFNFQSLKESLKNFPELIEFNNKYFDPKKNNQRNYIDDLIDSDTNNSSVFVAPLDYLIQNGVYKIQAHIPDYDKYFQSVKEEIELYNKLDKIIHLKQENNVKNVYDSRMDGYLTRTRILSIGEKDEREIISDFYNNNFYQITKNGQYYFALERISGNLKMVNMSNMFLNEYRDNNYLLIDQKTKERKVVTLEEILNWKNERDLTGYDLVEHKVDVIQPINPKVQNPKCNIEKDNRFYNTQFDNNLNINDNSSNFEYKTIQYYNGYYIGWTLNGKRYGEGKYVWNNGDYYIGNYRFNMRNGKGKYVYNNGTYEEGQWKNDNFIYGKKTYTNGDYYIGNFRFNMRNGKGTLVYNNGTYEEGQWKNNYFICGKKTYPNGDYYIGNFRFNMRNGKGKHVYNNGTYADGQWENDNFIYGKKTFLNGDYYIGNFLFGKRHGKYVFNNGTYEDGVWENGNFIYGTKTYPNGGYYIGNFLFGKRHGNGKYVCNDGNYEDGKWENDNFIYGIQTYSNGDYYIGNFQFNKRHGKGKYVYNDRTYEDGEWENGNFIYGIKTYPNGGYYIGNFLFGKRHGNGKYVWNDGNYEDGEWENDNFICGIKSYSNGDCYRDNFRFNKRNGNVNYVLSDGNYYNGSGKNNLKNGYEEQKKLTQ